MAMKAEEQAKADAAYGVLPVTEFDALRAQAAKPIVIEATFREDFAFDGPENFEVITHYEGGCTVCGLHVKFSDTHQIPDIPGKRSRP